MLAGARTCLWLAKVAGDENSVNGKQAGMEVDGGGEDDHRETKEVCGEGDHVILDVNGEHQSLVKLKLGMYASTEPISVFTLTMRTCLLNRSQITSTFMQTHPGIIVHGSTNIDLI